MAIAQRETLQQQKIDQALQSTPRNGTVGPLCLCVVSRRAQRNDPSHGSGNDGRPHHHGTRGRQRIRYDLHLMLPEGQTSAELTPMKKTAIPSRTSLLALASALGQPDGSPR